MRGWHPADGAPPPGGVILQPLTVQVGIGPLDQRLEAVILCSAARPMVTEADISLSLRLAFTAARRVRARDSSSPTSAQTDSSPPWRSTVS